MELHTFVGSPNSRKAEAVIDHLGLNVRVVHHDFAGGGLRRPEYLALNPSGMVPTLVDGAFTLWESNAIMQYLADKAGDGALLPRDPQKRADVLRWQCWELAHFNRAFGTLAFETVAKPALNFGPADASLVAAAQAGLERFAPVLERHLAGREQMVGDGVTIADYSMITFEGYRKVVPFDWTPYPNINRYFDRMHHDGSWIRTDPASHVSAEHTAEAA
jgi:glutathione S-transferase